VKAEPRLLQWTRQKTDERNVAQRTLTAVLQQKTLLMYEVNSTKQPLELVFEQKYGKIVDYSFFGDGYIVIGFTEGYFAHISTHLKELKDEVSSDRIFNTTLDALCTNDALYKLAIAGEGCIKFLNLSTWKEIKHEKITLPKGCGKIQRMAWSNNGQTLIVASQNGWLLGYMTTSPSSISTYKLNAAILKSFTEVEVQSCQTTTPTAITNINIESEPTGIVLGPNHLASCNNNNVTFYRWFDAVKGIPYAEGGEIVSRKDYNKTIKTLALNGSWAAALCEGGKCFVHPIEATGKAEGIERYLQSVSLFTLRCRTYPANEGEKPVVNMALSDNFLILLDTNGKIKYINLEDGVQLLEFKPEFTISKVA
jgi:WD repeat-containing protein 19